MMKNWLIKNGVRLAVRRFLQVLEPKMIISAKNDQKWWKLTSQKWCPFDRTAFPSVFGEKKKIISVKMSKNDERLTSQSLYCIKRHTHPKNSHWYCDFYLACKNNQHVVKMTEKWWTIDFSKMVSVWQYVVSFRFYRQKNYQW